MCFEYTGFSLLSIMHSVTCSLFAQGLTKGLVIDLGYGHSQIASFKEGLIVNHFVNEKISGQLL